MVQRGHGDRGHHGDFLGVVFEYENHVEVLHAEADSLKVAELHVLQGNDEWRPGCEVHQAAGGRQQEDSLSVRDTLQNI